ncbi:hypothetical protein VU04_11255, partial [Desulfobulbus sp. TB]|nr:hypothetical protein [Desulfobulbus sp. TB]
YYIGIIIKSIFYTRGEEAMYTQKIFQVVFVMMFIVLVTFVQSVASKELTGIVKKAPGIAWPYGSWKIGNNDVRVTDKTVIKGDQSKAHFGAKVIVRAQRVRGVFVADEFKIITDDMLTLASR